jgi:hypothetical protein
MLKRPDDIPGQELRCGRGNPENTIETKYPGVINEANQDWQREQCP